LLSALEGYAITSVRIEGVDHEFSTIGELLKMLPKLFQSNKYVSNVKLKILIMNQLLFLFQVKITIGDFQKIYFRFPVLNPELVICNLDSKSN
jgi:DNA-directed RNA polymerase subunit alpha